MISSYDMRTEWSIDWQQSITGCIHLSSLFLYYFFATTTWRDLQHVIIKASDENNCHTRNFVSVKSRKAKLLYHTVGYGIGIRSVPLEIFIFNRELAKARSSTHSSKNPHLIRCVFSTPRWWTLPSTWPADRWMTLFPSSIDLRFPCQARRTRSDMRHQGVSFPCELSWGSRCQYQSGRAQRSHRSAVKTQEWCSLQIELSQRVTYHLRNLGTTKITDLENYEIHAQQQYVSRDADTFSQQKRVTSCSTAKSRLPNSRLSRTKVDDDQRKRQAREERGSERRRLRNKKYPNNWNSIFDQRIGGRHRQSRVSERSTMWP